MKKIIIILAAVISFSAAAKAEDSMMYETSSQVNQKQKKAKAEIKEVSFHVHLHCANCVKKVQDNIAFEKGVKDLHVTTHSIVIKYDVSKTSEEVLKAAIENLQNIIMTILAKSNPIFNIKNPAFRKEGREKIIRRGLLPGSLQ